MPYKDKQKYNAYSNHWNKTHRKTINVTKKFVKIRNRVFIDEAKNKPCMDCNNMFPPCVMDFDHVRDKKSFIVSAGTDCAYSLIKIQKEIDKCDLVCSNCHRIRTDNRRTNKYLKGTKPK